MTPATLRENSLYADLNALFARAKASANYGLNALPEEEVAVLLHERLADLLVEAEDVIERLAGRRLATDARAA